MICQKSWTSCWMMEGLLPKPLGARETAVWPAKPSRSIADYPDSTLLNPNASSCHPQPFVSFLHSPLFYSKRVKSCLLWPQPGLEWKGRIPSLGIPEGQQLFRKACLLEYNVSASCMNAQVKSLPDWWLPDLHCNAEFRRFSDMQEAVHL